MANKPAPRPPRRRAAPTKKAEPPVAKTYKLDMYREEANGIDPFVLDTGEQQISIPPPTGEQLIQISETSVYDGKLLLSRICGDQFDAVWEVIRKEPAGVLLGLLRDLGQHFRVAHISAAPGGVDASPS